MTGYNTKKKSVLRIFKCKCPRCREGNMFVHSQPYHLKDFMEMNDQCPVCKQVLDMEPGFYYGTGYVSFAFTVFVSLGSFIFWWIFIGISIDDNRVLWWLIINSGILILTQPITMRLSRTFWLWCFVYYDPAWRIHEPKKPFSENKDLKDAW